MKIPKRFKLMGQTIEVVSPVEPFVENPDRIAFASYRTNQIQWNPTLTYKTNEQQEHAFLHELVHFIFYHSGSAYTHGKHEYMHQDENFVDLTANLLHQALATMEYEETA